MIKNLVFEGGGVKGIAYGGALIALEQKGILDNVTRVAGTSAGAITAVLLACGYTAVELSEIVAETDFNKFKDDSFGAIRDFNRLMNNYGWHEGDYFTQWIGELIARKLDMPSDITFSDLRAMWGTRDLYLTATNLSKQRVEVFSAEHTPNVEIRHAARMSMGIPFYFEAIKHGPDEDIMVDGGVSYNYPIDIFDGFCPEDETLGFRVDSPDEIRYDGAAPIEINGILDFAGAVVGFLQVQANKKHLKSADKARTVFIDTGSVKATDFDLSEQQVATLLAAGKQAVERYGL